MKKVVSATLLFIFLSIVGETTYLYYIDVPYDMESDINI